MNIALLQLAKWRFRHFRLRELKQFFTLSDCVFKTYISSVKILNLANGL